MIGVADLIFSLSKRLRMEQHTDGTISFYKETAGEPVVSQLALFIKPDSNNEYLLGIPCVIGVIWVSPAHIRIENNAILIINGQMSVKIS